MGRHLRHFGSSPGVVTWDPKKTQTLRSPENKRKKLRYHREEGDIGRLLKNRKLEEEDDIGRLLHAVCITSISIHFPECGLAAHATGVRDPIHFSVLPTSTSMFYLFHVDEKNQSGRGTVFAQNQGPLKTSIADLTLNRISCQFHRLRRNVTIRRCADTFSTSNEPHLLKRR